MEQTTITAMMRVRRWRWWPFAHKYVPAPRVLARDVLVTQAREVLEVTGVGPSVMTVKRGGA